MPLLNPTFYGPKYAPKSGWLGRCNDFNLHVDSFIRFLEPELMIDERDFIAVNGVIHSKYALPMSSEKALAEQYVDLLRRYYEFSKNPFCPWQAYLQCNLAEIPVPRWVNHYLEHCAVSIYALIEDGKERRIDKEIAEMTGFVERGKQAGFLKDFMKFVKIHKFLMLSKEESKIARNKTQVVEKVSEKLGISKETGWTYARHLEEMGIEVFLSS